MDGPSYILRLLSAGAVLPLIWGAALQVAAATSVLDEKVVLAVESLLMMPIALVCVVVCALAWRRERRGPGARFWLVAPIVVGAAHLVFVAVVMVRAGAALGADPREFGEAVGQFDRGVGGLALAVDVDLQVAARVPE